MRPGKRLLSSLPLQMSLYFNCFFYPLWIIGTLVVSSSSAEILGNTIYKLLFGAVAILEPVRLYVGYSSNLREKVSTLFGLLVLSVMFELPAVTALAFRSGVLPMEWALHLVQMVFLLVEGVCGYWATVLMTEDTAMRFTPMTH
eukprot:m.38272 g.38272  ORF g.38272 m.38272 type:complete len:144 (+) comp9950_c0_seq1:118-549(+)